MSNICLSLLHKFYPHRRNCIKYETLVKMYKLNYLDRNIQISAITLKYIRKIIQIGGWIEGCIDAWMCDRVSTLPSTM